MSRREEVVVLGGGLAGCAAATVLAERGVEVTVLERERYLGGRAGAFSDRLADGTPFEMERGFHAFFRNYKNLRALIKRVDPGLRSLEPLTDYPLFGPNGAESFASLTKLPLLNIVQLILRSKSMKLADLRHANLDRARAMLMFDAPRTFARFDDMTAKAFLDSLSFPTEARQMLFEVFAHSFFNPEDDYSAAELLGMFHFYFLRNPDGLVFDVMNEPFSTALWQPLRKYLEGLGVRFSLETEVTRVTRHEGRVRVEGITADASRTWEADAAVVALHVGGQKSVFRASPTLHEELDRIDSLEVTLPFAVSRLFLDRPLARGRPPFSGTAGFGILDNVSIYDAFESESRDWARRTGGSVVELHAYAVPRSLGAEAIDAELLEGLHAVFPESRDAKIIERRFLLRDDCPAFRPGSDARRPTVKTRYPDVVLAGDFVKLPFPSALMERATSSGFLAANTLLERFGRSGVKVEHGPLRGLLAGLGG